MDNAFNKTIFMGMPKPSEKCFLVSIPLLMFRIQTYKFVSGLNFFQKAVLKLKRMPSLTNDRISNLLSLDHHLVNIITEQLTDMELLTSTGNLTKEGERMLHDDERFIIDSKHKQIGYVFSYDDGREYYPYYQERLQYASIADYKLIYQTPNGEKSTELPFPVGDDIFPEIKAPSKQLVKLLIKNSSNKSLEDGDDERNPDEDLFGIKFIPDEKPESVRICTYVYLPSLPDGEGYEEDWCVLDPFGKGNSYELKLYVEQLSKKDRKLGGKLFEVFGDAETESRRSFADSQRWIDRQVDIRLNALFDAEKIDAVDANLLDHTRNIIEYFMRMEEVNFTRPNYAQSFLINIQSAIEIIFKLDQKEREDIFYDLNRNYRHYSKEEERRQCLNQVYRLRILSNSSVVPAVLAETKVKSWKGKSLLDYLMKFIMSFSVEPDWRDCNMVNVFKNRIDKIVDIASLRNVFGHGSTVSESRNYNLSEAEAREYYIFITGLLSDYYNTL